MIITTTPSVEGKSITEHLGIVGAESLVMGGLMANINIKEGLMANAAKARKATIGEVYTTALASGADAIVDVEIKHKPISGVEGSMMVMVSGNAVNLESNEAHVARAARVMRRRVGPV